MFGGENSVNGPGYPQMASRWPVVTWGGGGSGQRFVYLGDSDLTGFGPYYGAAWSDLEDFERSIGALKKIEATGWLTFHHMGLIEHRSSFLDMLESFENMIAVREENLTTCLSEPGTMQEIVAHRFVCWPGTEVLIIDATQKRSMSMHLDRLIRKGVVKNENGNFSVTR